MEINNSLTLIAPGIIVALTAVLVLAVDLLVTKKAVLAWVAATGLVAAAAVAVGQGLALARDAALANGGGQAGYAGMIALDRYAVYCIVLFAVIGVLTVMLADSYMARRGAARGEFYGLLLFVIAGMIGLVMSTDVISFFVFFELMSLPTYVLAGYLRRQSRSGEAALKYFVVGAFSSAILAFGLALLYGASGQTNYAAIAANLAGLPPTDSHGLLVVALILIVVGFGFKVSAVPFHGWAPDVYEGAPTPVTAFMSVGIKAAAFAGFAKLFVTAVDAEWGTWGNALIVLSILTMIVGNVLALPQRNLKRMLAYSSIAHAGYLTLGLIAAGRSEADIGLSAILFYLVAYALMNLGAFGVLIWVRDRLSAFSYALDEMSGLSKRMPWSSLAMALFMVSLTGIPPAIGFWGKFYLFAGVVQGRYTWLAIVAVIMSAVSAFYYLRVVWYMYFREAPGTGAEEGAAGDLPRVSLGSDQAVARAVVQGVTVVADADAPTRQTGVGAVLALTAAGTLLLGLFPQPLLDLAQWAVGLILTV